MRERTNEPSKALPAGVLVFYDEGKGVRQPNVKVFNPSPGIEQEVNDWIAGEAGVIVHRVDWVPSGGLMGASVLYSKGHRATESVRLPAAPGRAAAAVDDILLQKLGVSLILVGVAIGLVAVGLFALFYPAVWYGYPEAAFDMDPDLAVKSTVLVGGIGGLLTALGLGLIFWARVKG